MTQPSQETLEGRYRALVVEDEPDQRELLRYNLARNGFEVYCAETGSRALAILEEQTPDVIVLDLMLPGMDGLQVCQSIRSRTETSAIPIVMLTARGEDTDIVAGLELGADDYITKPYSPRVLLARVKAVMRSRSKSDGNGQPAGDEPIIRHGDLVIRPERFEVSIDSKPIKLSGTEFRMLVLLAGKPGRVFTRAQIIAAVHGNNCAVTDRSVDVHIFWLRQKLGSAGQLVEAVRGVGYRFRDAES